MKTKALLVAGLMMAASAASSLAQTVYSVNAVGFVNVVLPPGYSLVCNPLDSGTNTVASLFPSASIGTVIYKFNPQLGGFDSASFGRSGWGSSGTLTLNPGEGFFYKNPSATTITNTFVGNVMQGTLSTPLSAGFNLVGSQVPQQGLVSTDLQLPFGIGDSIYQWDTSVQTYVSASQGRGGAWNPAEPTIKVGEGFFVKKSAAAPWTRVFSVNQ